MHLSALLLLAGTAALATAGPTHYPRFPPCKAATDCAGARVCDDGYCVPDLKDGMVPVLEDFYHTSL